MFIAEIVADCYIIDSIALIVLECSLKAPLRSKLRNVPVILIQYSRIFFLAKIFAMFAHGCTEATCALIKGTLTFGCARIYSTFSSACESEWASEEEIDTTSEIFGTSERFLYLAEKVLKAFLAFRARDQCDPEIWHCLEMWYVG